jgi:hypothetical protein
MKGLENQEELEDYIDVERKILKAVGDYCHRELQSVGIKGIQSEGGYYYMPDFEICRDGFAKKGIVNGKEMCSAMLKGQFFSESMMHFSYCPKNLPKTILKKIF